MCPQPYLQHRLGSTIGISPSEMHDIFPHHLAIDSEMRIIQVGENLASLIGSSKDLMGTPVQNMFNIVSPRCDWDLNTISKLDKYKFELKLKDPIFSTKKTTLSLKGGVIVSIQLDGKQTVLFLLSLNLGDYADLRAGGFTLTDISRYTLQKELLSQSKLYYA